MRGRPESGARAAAARLARSVERTSLVFGLAAVALVGAVGCGDDKPAGPDQPASRRILFPGDASTLQAAIDMASPGDTVVVGPGTHAIDSTLVFRSATAGVTLLGRTDAEAAKQEGGSRVDRPVLDFTRTPASDGILISAGVSGVTVRGLDLSGTLRIGVGLLGPGARLVDCVVRQVDLYSVSCTQATSDGRIEGNLLLYPGVYGVYAILEAHPTAVGNTIVGAGVCDVFTSGSAGTFERNIVVLAQNFGFDCSGPPFPTLACNDVFGNGISNFSGCVPGAGDIQLDPIFCDSTAFSLRSDSPCAAANAGACGQIGAAGVGCAAVGSF